MARRSNSFRKRLRANILRDRGLEPKPYGQLKPSTPETITVRLAGSRTLKVIMAPTGIHKSIVQRLIEERIGQPLEDVLWLGTLKEVAGALGVDYSTVSKWRKQLTNGSDSGATGVR